MQYNTLGKTDLRVSKICLGSMTWGQQNTEKEGHEQLDYAFGKGVNFIDTAEMYSVPGSKETQGSTERIIGTWLNARKKRDDVVLATKVTGPSAGLSYIRNPLNFSKSQINEALEGSLKRLQTDYVDIYQLHWPERNVNIFGQRAYKHNPDEQWEDNLLEILQTIDELIKAGKIRHFGISNESPWGTMRFLQLAEEHNLPRAVSIQNSYNLLNRTFEIALAEIAMREQINLLAYSPMGFGLLSGKYHEKLDKPEDRINQFKSYSRYSSGQSYEATSRYLEIAKNHNLSLAQLSLAFVSSRPFVGGNIIGASNLDQLKENIESIDVKLSDEVLTAIEEVQKMIPNPAP